MRVLMLPTLESQKQNLSSGVGQVITNYHKYAKEFGIDFVLPGQKYDVSAVHAGSTDRPCDVAILHGLYWTADYNASQAEYRTNARIINSIRTAKEITVPSNWVAETIRREVRVNPHIIPHGIDWQEWNNEHYPPGDYILWNKNRNKKDVCNAESVIKLAELFPEQRFLSTFADKPTPNIKVTGLMPFEEMKPIIQQAAIYLATTKETFGIGTLEAMASGVPILGWAYGGNLDLVQHGINGYLATPNDYDDLAEGLRYCLNNRKQLGDNSREMAKLWTWQDAVQKLVKVLELANRREPATVGVVIPVYNKSPKEIRRAIDSVLNQTLKPNKIVVVDDGSTKDDTREFIKELEKKIIVIQQKNQGVAIARNNGIAACNTKYISCLDADDWIEPDFLKVCVQALEADPSLGIARTKLMRHRPDGRQQIERSRKVDADKQMEGQNQVPTCCVFRRKVWERLGGYRQRYAPDGAGAEDGEFWLRQMAYGWRAEEVSELPLFNYSWLTGQVSGNKSYQPVNWTEWHPFSEDKRHPFMSVARPSKGLLSHPVRQYDEPVVSVVIPVGPGHKKYLIDALDSLEAQTFRKWEAIVVRDYHTESLTEILKPYPYVRYVDLYDYFPGFEMLTILKKDQQRVKSFGAGFARNCGAEIAKAPFLLFLDADDWLRSRALEEMLKAWNETEGVIYSDYLKIIHNATKEQVKKTKARIIEYNEEKQKAIIGLKAYDFDCERAVRQPEGPIPYYWCLTTTLIPKAWHNEIGGFDEKMESWEDADYAFRMVKAGHCYTRVPEELIVVRAYSGTRLNKGLQIHEDLVKYMSRKKVEVKTVCSGCGNKVSVAASSVKATTDRRLVSAVPDKDMILVEYLSANVGGHHVYGEMINPTTGNKFFYGKRKGGDIFLVHKDDVFKTNPRTGQITTSNRFKPVEDQRQLQHVKAPPAPPKPATRPPQSLDELAERRARIQQQTEEKFTIPEISLFDLTTLPGMTEKIFDQMQRMGIKSNQDIINLGIDGLTQIKGIGDRKAEKILEYLEQ